MVPKGWKKLIGEEIADKITKGSSPKWQGFDYQDSGCLFVTSENVREGYLDISKPKYLPLEFNEKLKNSQLKQGDILINIVGASIGRSCLIQKDISPANINQAVCLFRVKKNISHEYVSFYLQAPHIVRKLLGSQTESARPNLSLSDLRSFSFDIPPIFEQEKIASILSTWDEAIEKLEKLIETKKKRKKGLMQQLLNPKKKYGKLPDGWKLKKMEECVKYEGGAQPPRDTFIFEERLGYIRLIQIRDYKTDNFKTYIKEELARKKCTKEDVMIGRYGPPIFQVLRGIEGAYNVALMKAIPRDGLDREYMYYFLSQEKIERYLDGFSQRSAGQAGIEMDMLLSYPFPLPTKKDQEKIVVVLTAVDKEISLYHAKLDKLKNQKKGLMQQLLTGKKRVQI
ncbi:restriction endonuclease subunit S [Halobacteriovorax sp. DA5]|uniref:restriction endonuclease subunit S n=1 Tax=Halobacteriovorax sp. DA5 TaxID=2067553 RepID=UPI000CD2204A|nr:restriction endonuclease subunit S [Halobacteriovorax sp. DA5]POB13851.1 hypothetical protein C0Z22_07265 [Halobacteriovorax sp. DA5]